ncbi:hypothetical protein [Phytohabitans rumicis]|uniref:Uncharacterized protein n=1 Tax=Phytohabitans rumicis TaxID=1076125 RepID=A0A6V8LR04_9ACTN|nr:hypothetical protein [Phytohabitans rumicis]GFJ95165.1 hypothetical protein Prum_088070 [Phytohabitans rumicis]
MADDLTHTDYAFLILLKIEGREVDNTELFNAHGVRLYKDDTMRLNGLGYLESNTRVRPYRHKLTPTAKKLLGDPLTVTEDGADVKKSKSKNGSKEQQLWAALSALHAYHLGRPRAPEPVHGGLGDLGERIRSAYAGLATEPGAWVSLTRLRPLFGDVSRAELDKALERLLDAPDVDLEPEPNQKTLKVEDRRAAVEIGGEHRHVLAIGMR